jgi:hypothetical protein
LKFFSREFPSTQIRLYPLGDWHFGSPQCHETFIQKVVDTIKSDKDAYWVGMGDLMENAIVGSKGDTYTQTVPPREQMDYICDILAPISNKGLFVIAGNHEQRTMRVVGIIPEQYFSVKLGIPYLGFSCLANLSMNKARTPKSFNCYFHHNYGGGYTPGGKVNRAEALRKIVPTADAIFSGHFHTTSRVPVTWYDCGDKQVLKKTGYDYITGSALMWDESYAEEKGKPASTVEHIVVTFIGSKNGHGDSRRQIYEVIQP